MRDKFNDRACLCRYGYCAVFIFSLLGITTIVQSMFLAFKKGPNFDDPCTIVFHSIPMANIIEYHPKPECLKTDIFWGRVSGRVRMHLQFPDNRAFNACITHGLHESIYVFYDYARQYSEPWVIPSGCGDPKTRRYKDKCKPSINGSLDFFMHAPWAKSQYMGYFSYEVTLTPERDDIVVLKNPYIHPEDLKDDDEEDDEEF